MGPTLSRFQDSKPWVPDFSPFSVLKIVFARRRERFAWDLFIPTFDQQNERNRHPTFQRVQEIFSESTGNIQIILQIAETFLSVLWLFSSTSSCFLLEMCGGEGSFSECIKGILVREWGSFIKKKSEKNSIFAKIAWFVKDLFTSGSSDLRKCVWKVSALRRGKVCPVCRRPFCFVLLCSQIVNW